MRKSRGFREGGQQMKALSEKVIFSFLESKEAFPIDFEAAWQWYGYSRKDKAKTALIANFSQGIDFELLHQIGEQKKVGKGGHNKEVIKLSNDCFKAFGMMAGTEKGKEIRNYFLQCEKKLQQLHNVATISHYTDTATQKGLVKQVAGVIYHSGEQSDIIEHHQEVYKIHFGMKPSEFRNKLVKQGQKVKSKSGREIARLVKPEAACSMAYHDDMVSKGHSLDKLKAMHLKEKLEPAFKAIMDLGFTPIELLK